MFGLNPKLDHWASKLLKLLAQQENLLVPDYWNGWDFFQALSWEIVQMPAYERPEAVAIFLLLNTLLNTHYFLVLFRWARACMKRGRSARHKQQEKVQEKCVVSGTPSSIWVAFVCLKNTQQKRLLCRPVVKKWKMVTGKVHFWWSDWNWNLSLLSAECHLTGRSINHITKTNTGKSMK